MTTREDKADKLMEALLDAFTKRVSKDDCTATDLNVIRQFLRDNNITLTDPKHRKVQELTEKLPYDETEDTGGAALN